MFYRVCDISTSITSAFSRMLGATRHAHSSQASSFHPFLPDCQLCCGRNKRPEFSAWLTEVKKVGLDMTVMSSFSDKKVTRSTLAHRLPLIAHLVQSRISLARTTVHPNGGCVHGMKRLDVQVS